MTIQEFENIFQPTSAKALATYGPHGINVVPVSVSQYHDGEVILFNFFMNKTAENLLAVPECSLVVWNGTQGTQMKGKVSYESTGELFESYRASMSLEFPDRTLQAIIRIQDIVLSDISLPKV